VSTRLASGYQSVLFLSSRDILAEQVLFVFFVI
jgi:hypothetical protein